MVRRLGNSKTLALRRHLSMSKDTVWIPFYPPGQTTGSCHNLRWCPAILQCGPVPIMLNWFINPMNTIVLSITQPQSIVEFYQLGYQSASKILWNPYVSSFVPYKLAFFLWFSHGFPMKSPFSYGFPMKAPFFLNEITLKSRFLGENQPRSSDPCINSCSILARLICSPRRKSNAGRSTVRWI